MAPLGGGGGGRGSADGTAEVSKSLQSAAQALDIFCYMELKSNVRIQNRDQELSFEEGLSSGVAAGVNATCAARDTYF